MRADAALNRQRVLDAARAAFADSGVATSMAEVVRRSGVGAATLYRNFPSREALLQALLLDEVDELCATAATVQAGSPGERLADWLRRFFAYVTTKRPVVLDLLVLEGADPAGLKISTRRRLTSAVQPLLAAAQEAGEVRDDLDLDQVLDLIMAVAKINGTVEHRRPILGVVLAGLRPES
ncbi:TetR/AcrR family transcriptional regulator [Microlunatus flavus]|uniref:DNA-binding transcriptional regulator, AcrR family n=1 Tax=Microlunatus flavus TaxID=1036181 RepID=A0A1H9IZL0_9ACTN|nr:TetR/AcrR family transcriptional regulator [Microlunatus flavus]SEQ79958.1 DNA-binding transcriptional regulator, AcrR family [Microlunatus flavus]